MSAKPRILLNWGYHRIGWLHAINALNDEFEFHFIFYVRKPKDEVNHSLTDKIHYWSDYNSAQHILRAIKPAKIVFMGVEGINSLALNIQAQKRGVETIILQHGMFHKYDDYLRLAQEENKERAKANHTSEEIKSEGKFLLGFFLKSIWMMPGAVLYMLKLQYWKKKVLNVKALKKVQSNYREADKYIVFTIDNASIFKERDGVSEDKMIPIGNPEMDVYFKDVKKQSAEKFYLLIDQPWSEVKDFNSPGFGISKSDTIDFHLKLAEFAKMNGATMKIKLHPYSYSSDFYPKHANLEYLKDCEVVELIKGAQGVFGFSSTLMHPAIYFNKCCLFKIWEDSSFQETVRRLGVAQVLDYHNFSIDDISLDDINKEGQNMAEFVDHFLYSSDGNSVGRLKQILLED